MLVTQFIHVHISFILDMINPNDRRVVLECQRDMGSLTTATTSARTHPEKVWDCGAPLVDRTNELIRGHRAIRAIKQFGPSSNSGHQAIRVRGVTCDFYSATPPQLNRARPTECHRTVVSWRNERVHSSPSATIARVKAEQQPQSQVGTFADA
jgi:hypothetical protein